MRGAFLLAALLACVAAAKPAPPVVVESVDLPRYMGAWHEIAHLPNFPQKGCTDTVVHYRLRDDGGFDLANTCWKSGKYKPYFGKARPWTKGDTARFHVKFFMFFGGDYWIIDLDPAYRWAAVGDSAKKQLWVISREKTLHPQAYDGILERAKAQGFDVSALVKTLHTGKPSKGFED